MAPEADGTLAWNSTTIVVVHVRGAGDVRIEQLLFDGVAAPRDGALFADLERPGHGLELKQSEAERYEV